MVDHIAEAHAVEQQLKDLQVKRLCQRNAKLTRDCMREQAIVSKSLFVIHLQKENMAENTGYSNPAKLMNYLKIKKSLSNSNFQTVNQYLSHMQAFTRLTCKQTEEERARQKQILV